MTKHIKLIIIALALVGAVAGGFYFMGGSEEPTPDQKETAADRRAEARKRKAEARKKARARTMATPRKTTEDVSVLNEEEAALPANLRSIAESLHKALDSENRDQVLKLVQQLQKSKDWPNGIPVILRQLALDAVTWFGIDTLPEVAGFLADDDEDIRTNALNAYENATIEAIDDKELSTIVTSAAAVITDANAIDSILMKINEMETPMAVKTIKQIWRTGTSESKEALKEVIEFLTDEKGIDAPWKLDNWYRKSSSENMDDETDEEN